jgi:HD-GYP domain-containing protein (c-di-GMP phosphodiesterase class II)
MSSFLVVAIAQGALLHDIGKIGVPDNILLKPGPLTLAEWAVMRHHSSMGARLLDGMVLLEGARDVVLQHHERWDGTGYPGDVAAQSGTQFDPDVVAATKSIAMSEWVSVQASLTDGESALNESAAA